MLFWTDGLINSDRDQNVHFTWDKLKKLSNFFTENNIPNDVILYDYSPNRIHQEAIHIPYELNEFKKSKKINQIIKDNSSCDYFFFFDCDVFFDESDHGELLKLIKSSNENQIYTFDLAKLDKSNSKLVLNGANIDKKNMDWNFAYSGKKEKGPLYQLNGGLGGSFFITRKLLIDGGGFDESIDTWGGEDGHALNSIFVKKLIFNFMAVRHIYPFHLYHETLWSNPKYYVHK